MTITAVQLNYKIGTYPQVPIQLNAIYDAQSNTFIFVDENGNQLTTDDTNQTITTDPE